MPIRLNGSTSGYSQLDAPAVAGDQLFTLPGTGGTLLTLGTSGRYLTRKNATGNVVEFDGIPSWTKKITITFGGVSVSGTGVTAIAIQLGTANGWNEQNHVGVFGYQGGAASNIMNMNGSSFQIYADTPTDNYYGTVNLVKVSDMNWWSLSALLAWDLGRPFILPASGAVSTAGPVTKLRLFIQNPAFVFDLGFFDVLCEG